MNIRAEKESDIKATFEVAKQAFENHPISQGVEQFIINALRKDNALTVSLVALV